MFRIELGNDDFEINSNAVKIGAAVKAIAKVLLAEGSPNKLQAERDAWPFVHTGIQLEKLHPLIRQT